MKTTQIFHGTVTDINDPENRGRIKVELTGFSNSTPFCHIISPFAGNGYGLFFRPQVGDEVIAVQLASGDWAVLGFHWSGRKTKPTEGNDDRRVIKTPVGHKLIFDDNTGDITLESAGGAQAVLKANGDIELNGSAGKMVTTRCTCAYTGSLHHHGISSVKGGT